MSKVNLLNTGSNTTKRYSISIMVLITLLPALTITAQPFLDIVNLKYTNSPNTGLINQNSNKIKSGYFNLSLNLPVQFKNKKDAVIFSPFFENWSVQISNNRRQNYYSVVLPVSLVKTIPYTRWGILLTAIVRMNDSSIHKKTKMQVGGALLVTNKRNENLTWKLGLYVNNELFGVFVIPLAGIDWKINDRNMIFGLLPGNIIYEHQINKHFYYGAGFRAITNSYATGIGYWRIDENQLGLYLDTYFNKNFVLNIEAGHSLFRKVRTGVKDVSKYNAAVNDNMYVKIGLAYRVRFENKK